MVGLRRTWHMGEARIIVCHCVKAYLVGLLYKNTFMYLAMNHFSQSIIVLIDLASSIFYML